MREGRGSPRGSGGPGAHAGGGRRGARRVHVQHPDKRVQASGGADPRAAVAGGDARGPARARPPDVHHTALGIRRSGGHGARLRGNDPSPSQCQASQPLDHVLYSNPPPPFSQGLRGHEGGGGEAGHGGVQLAHPRVRNGVGVALGPRDLRSHAGGGRPAARRGDVQLAHPRPGEGGAVGAGAADPQGYARVPSPRQARRHNLHVGTQRV
mmetsp:Transcript_22574/g.70055  ORF Transcript_22574/g.70055 Transcript_22574/m.70055 type:complete len:210 (+) Transcript_22574:686-1315(+)